MGMRNSLEFLAVDEEKAEVQMVLNTMRIKLHYNGVQRFPGHPGLRLWTILSDCFHNGYNFKGSTRSVEGLQELGVIK